jgi:DNA-3-methyladenine glycosylase II
MAPLAEPWRPVRGAAAHLWWAYYKVMKKREGIIADQGDPNGVLNESPVAKPTSTKTTIATKKKSKPKPSGSKT